jgi:hypothetical protein
LRTYGRNIGGKVYGNGLTWLPEQPHLDVPKREAREVLDLWREQRTDALGSGGGIRSSRTLRPPLSPSASVLGKLVALFALIYAISPVDLILDVPIVGWIDDLGVMGLATWWLSRVVTRYRRLEAAAESEPALAARAR